MALFKMITYLHGINGPPFQIVLVLTVVACVVAPFLVMGRICLAKVFANQKMSTLVDILTVLD
jgi:hypothetical protein